MIFECVSINYTHKEEQMASSVQLPVPLVSMQMISMIRLFYSD